MLGCRWRTELRVLKAMGSQIVWRTLRAVLGLEAHPGVTVGFFAILRALCAMPSRLN